MTELAIALESMYHPFLSHPKTLNKYLLKEVTSLMIFIPKLTVLKFNSPHIVLLYIQNNYSYLNYGEYFSASQTVNLYVFIIVSY